MANTTIGAKSTILYDYQENPFSKTYTLPSSGLYLLFLVGFGSPGQAGTGNGFYVVTVGTSGNVAVHSMVDDSAYTFDTSVAWKVKITTATKYYTGIIINTLTC